jgi:hypothetical protein
MSNHRTFVAKRISLIQSVLCLQHTIHPDVFAAQPQSGTKAPEFTREVTSLVFFLLIA